MIVLAKKIVMDNVEPIPQYYDKQLNEIVGYLLFYVGKCLKKMQRRE